MVVGSSQCNGCPVGTFASVSGVSSSALCASCPEGSLNTFPGSTICSRCPAGTFAFVSGANVSCHSCSVGTYSTRIGGLAGSCVYCSVGTFSSAESSSSCISCEPGTFTSQIGSLKCSKCEEGKYMSFYGALECRNCKNGTYMDTMGASSAAQCVPCQPGYVESDSKNCSKCPEGFITNKIGASVCTACPAGTFSFTSSSCMNCIGGTFSTGTGAVTALACIACSAGHFSISGSARCQLCPAGSYSNSSLPFPTNVSMCPSGPLFAGVKTLFDLQSVESYQVCLDVPYSHQTTQTDLYQCNVNPFTYLLVGARESGASILTVAATAQTGSIFALTTSATASSFSNGVYWYNYEGHSFGFAGSSDINLNQADTSSDDCQHRLSWHLDLGIGGYRAGCTLSLNNDNSQFRKVIYVLNSDCESVITYGGSGSNGCNQCEFGKYSSKLGATSSAMCLDCPAAKFSSTSGSSSCVTCEAGTFTSYAGSSFCTGCAPGTYSISSEANSSLACSSCQVGFFSNFSGLSSCKSCLAGKYSSSMGSTLCFGCPGGKYSSQDRGVSSAVCSTCTAGTYIYDTFDGHSSCSTCSSGLFFYGKCFEVSQYPMDWNSANAACVQRGGNLVSVYSDEAYQFIESAVSLISTDLWIGYTYSGNPQSAQTVASRRAGKKGTKATTSTTQQTTTTTSANISFNNTSLVTSSNSSNITTTSANLSINNTSESLVTSSKSSNYEILEWRWVDGLSSKYTMWDAFNPKTPFSNYACTYMRVKNQPVEYPKNRIWWQNDNCSVQKHFLCYYSGPCSQKLQWPMFINFSTPSPCIGCEAGKYRADTIEVLYSEDIPNTNCSSCPAGKYAASTGASECTLCAAGTFSTGIQSFRGVYDKEAIVCNSSDLVNVGNPVKFMCPEGLISRLQYGNLEQAQWVVLPLNWRLINISFVTLNTELGYDMVELYECLDELCFPSPNTFVGAFSGDTAPSIVLYSGIGFLVQWSSDATISYPTFNGWILNWTSETNSVCDACPAGRFSIFAGGDSNETCLECLAGSYSLRSGSDLCQTCEPGTYSNIPGSNSSFDCLSCENGKFSTVRGGNSSLACTACYPGSFSSRSGASECVQCFVGKYSTAVSSTSSYSCSLCSTGKYNELNGSSLCIYCTAGKYSSILGADTVATCKSCVSGKYSSQDAANTSEACVPCNAGSFSNLTDLSACYFCAAGTFSDLFGSTSCAVCQAPAFSSQLGGTTCLQCLLGMFFVQNAYKETFPCTLCDAGFYSSNIGATLCSACEIGSFFTGLGADNCTLCRLGTYFTGSELNTECTKCNIGTFSSSEGLSSCQQCSVGSYSSTTESSTCFLCATGSYVSGFEMSECKQCAPGEYSDQNGTTNCSMCPCGWYTSSSGSFQCQICPAGSYSDLDGASNCSVCTVNHFASGDGASSCLSCGPGTYSTILGTVKCSLCPEGSYFAGTERYGPECNACPAGSYQDQTGATRCASCWTGSFSALNGSTTCIACATGSYFAGNGSTACLACQAGTYADRNGSSLCLQCSPGRFASQNASSQCYICNAGKYSFGNGTINCSFCNRGTISSAQGAVDCFKCGYGMYVSGMGCTVCQSCASGTFYSGLGATTCNLCFAGSYSTGFGSRSCTGCLGGTFSTSSGSNVSESCTLCVAGTYSSQLGAVGCDNCPQGTFSTASAANTSLNCVQCPSGYYQDFTARTDCRMCAAGTYVVLGGQTVCSLCRAGLYTSTAGSSICLNCVEGTYSTCYSSSFCYFCPAGYYSTGQQATMSDTCQLCIGGKYSSTAAASSPQACIPCASGKYSNLTGGSSEADCRYLCSEGKYSSNNGATSQETCELCLQGTFSIDEAATACTACKYGTFLTSSGSNYDSCLECAEGTFSTSAGAVSNKTCKKCSAGYFSIVSGATLCEVCPAGTYATTQGASAQYFCFSCPTGTYSHRVTDNKGSLLLYYPFVAASLLIDGSGNEIPLIAASPPTLPSTQCMMSDSCVTFNSSYGIGFTFGSLHIAGSPGVSVCLWYNADDLVLEGQVLFDFSGGLFMAERALDSNDLAVLVHHNNKVIFNAFLENALTPGYWNHLCITCSNNSGWKIYLNGSMLSDTSGSLPDTIEFLSLNWTSNAIGSSSMQSIDPQPMFMGRMQQVRVYAKALSAADVIELFEWRDIAYNATACSSCTAGTYSSDVGASSIATCLNCSAGSYAKSENSSTCTACTPGKVSTGTGLNSSESCINCAGGTYSETFGSTLCTVCLAGKYSTAVGSSSVLCPVCGLGSTSADGATACRRCTSEDSCYAWQCPSGQFRAGENCSNCSSCSSLNSTLKPCSAYGDTQCDPCETSSCSTVSAAMSFTGFNTITDFEAYAAVSFRFVVAQNLGLGPSNIVLDKVCLGTSCDILVPQRRDSSQTTVTADFSALSAIDPSIIKARLSSSNFSSSVASSMGKTLGINISSAGGVTGLSIGCSSGKYLSDKGFCFACTVCSEYLVPCAADSDAVCKSSGYSFSTTFIIVVAVVSVTFLGVVGALVWVFLNKEFYSHKKFLKEAKKIMRDNSLSSTPPLPFELESLYTVKKLLGRDKHGYIVAAESKKEKRPVSIKIVIDSQTQEHQAGLEKEILLKMAEKECLYAARLIAPKDENASKFKGGGGSWFIMTPEGDEGTQDLQTWLKNWNRPKSELVSECINAARCVLAALKAMHSEDYIHCNVVSENIVRAFVIEEKREADRTPRRNASRKKGVQIKESFKSSTNSDSRTENHPGIYQSENYIFKLVEYGSARKRDDTASEARDLQDLGKAMQCFLTPGQEPFCESNMDSSFDSAQRNLCNGFTDVISKACNEQYSCADEMHEDVFQCLIESKKEVYTVFLSYRSEPEAALANILFDELHHSHTHTGQRVTVYWDKRKMVHGHDWNDGIKIGLLNSLCFVPLVSEEYIKTAGATVTNVRASDAPDEDDEDIILEELIVAGTLLQKSKIYPIKVGAFKKLEGDYEGISMEHLSEPEESNIRISTTTYRCSMQLLRTAKISRKVQLKNIMWDIKELYKPESGCELWHSNLKHLETSVHLTPEQKRQLKDNSEVNENRADHGQR